MSAYLIDTPFTLKTYFSAKEVSPKMFVIVVFLLQLTTGVLTQSVFDPASFTQDACAGNYQWTIWFDSENPSATIGEFEITNHIQQLFPSFMCPVPTAIEVILYFIFIFFFYTFLYSRLVQ